MKNENCKLRIDGLRHRARIAALAILVSIGGSVSSAAQPDRSDDWPELDPKSPRLSFVEAAFRDADGDPRSLSQSQLTRWLAPVPGQKHRFFETNRGRGVVAG